jgi:hypothetical protein
MKMNFNLIHTLDPANDAGDDYVIQPMMLAIPM